jgi:hypothetical protein
VSSANSKTRQHHNTINMTSHSWYPWKRLAHQSTFAYDFVIWHSKCHYGPHAVTSAMFWLTWLILYPQLLPHLRTSAVPTCVGGNPANIITETNDTTPSTLRQCKSKRVVLQRTSRHLGIIPVSNAGLSTKGSVMSVGYPCYHEITCHFGTSA